MKLLPALLALLSMLGAAPALAGGPTTPGRIAVVRRGMARAPSKAPQAVKEAIWAANTLRHKPYRWGGGHGSFDDVGYDCSGTVSFLLHAAGLLDQPTTSSALQDWGEPGPGRWITIYAKSGHTFAIVCGLRLDTSGRHGERGPRWRTAPRSLRAFVARHPAGL